MVKLSPFRCWVIVEFYMKKTGSSETTEMPVRELLSSIGVPRVRPPSSNGFSSGVYRMARTAHVEPAKTTLDLDGYVAWVSGRPISLRPMEQRLLTLLTLSSNRVVSTESLIIGLYGNIAMEAGRVRLRRLVTDIRRRLGAEFAQRLRTVHKVGLVIVDTRPTT